MNEVALASHGDGAEMKFQAARDAYANALKRNPGNFLAYMHHGIALFKLGDLKKSSGRGSTALEDFKRADREFALAALLKPKAPLICTSKKQERPMLW